MTMRPLAELIPELVEYVRDNEGRIEFANRLNLIDAGQLSVEIEKSLRDEFKSETVKKILPRIPCINLLSKIVDKVSKIYDSPVTRTSSLDGDVNLIQFYTQAMDLDANMSWANRAYNLHESCALEPYLDMTDTPRLRVLTPDQFIVWSDDPTNPLNPTVFIKFMGDAKRIQDESTITRDGVYLKPSEDARVNIYYIYSNSEFLVVDSDGQLRPDLTPPKNINGINPIGELPAIYINKSKTHLLPLPNTDLLSNTLLVPKLLGDLNYAVKYLSHSIVLVKDMDVPDNIDRNPDAVWNFKSTNAADEAQQGSVDVITPKIDIDAVIRLIQTIVATWLESLGVRPGNMGQPTGSSRTSAVAKIVDEADTTAFRNSQVGLFSSVEKRLFSLIAKYHNVWRTTSKIQLASKFSNEFDISVMFPEQKLFSSEKERIEKASMLLDKGLATKKQALKLIYPDMSDRKIVEWIEELNVDVNTVNQIQPSNEQNLPEDNQSGESREVGRTDS